MSKSRSPHNLRKHDFSLTPTRDRSRSRSYSDISFSSCSRSSPKRPGYHTRKITYRPERYHSEDDRSCSRSKERLTRKSRIKSRSRSRTSRRRRPRYTRSRSYSRSRSSRSGTRSPRSSRNKLQHLRDDTGVAQPCKYLGIFGLNKETTNDHLYQIFAKYGPINSCQIVMDKKSGESRGFAFINYENVADAKIAKESSAGVEVDGHKLRVDYSFTQRAHTPTPGVYMGKAAKISERDRRNSRDRYVGTRYFRDRTRRRSSSSRDRSRHSRTRSQSYSPKYR